MIFKIFRTGVLGIFQKTVGKAFYFMGLVFIEDSMHKSGYGVYHTKGRQLASREYIITYGDVLDLKDLKGTFIDAFVMSA